MYYYYYLKFKIAVNNINTQKFLDRTSLYITKMNVCSVLRQTNKKYLSEGNIKMKMPPFSHIINRIHF